MLKKEGYDHELTVIFLACINRNLRLLVFLVSILVFAVSRLALSSSLLDVFRYILEIDDLLLHN